MLEYAWGNPSPILLSGEESRRDSEQTRQILDQYYSQSLPRNLLTTANAFSPGHHFQRQEYQNQTHFQSLHDSRAHSFSYQPPPMTSLVPEHVSNNSDIMVVTKSEEASGSGGVDFHGRLGLNLGVRTYFSSEEDFVNRMFHRSRLADTCPLNSPRCQSEGCNADLSHGKHYHRRRKVCEFHSKTSTVFVGGLCQRFCQQCSRFHLLSEFDKGKRSCRRRLADHNRRRRKSQPPQQQQKQRIQDQQQLQLESNLSSPSENTGRSSPESGAHSSSSVTVEASPPRMTLLGSREYIASSPFSSTSSRFFSGG